MKSLVQFDPLRCERSILIVWRFVQRHAFGSWRIWQLDVMHINILGGNDSYGSAACANSGSVTRHAYPTRWVYTACSVSKDLD